MTTEFWPIDLDESLAYLSALPPLLEALETAGGSLRTASGKNEPLPPEEAGSCISRIDSFSFAISRLVEELLERTRLTLDAQCAAAQARLAAAHRKEKDT